MTKPYAAGPGFPREPPSVNSFAFTAARTRRTPAPRTDAPGAVLRLLPLAVLLERPSRAATPRRVARVRPRRAPGSFPRRRETFLFPGCTRSSARSCRCVRRPPRRGHCAPRREPRAERRRRACGSGLGVDLRLLQPAAVVDVD